MSVEKNFVVGIGASAGGLEALTELVSSLPKAINVVYIVAQHLSPSHSSLLPELLSSKSSIAVVSAEQDMALRGGQVYITPPNQDVAIVGDKLKLSEPSGGVGPKPSVDVLLQSIASQCGERGIAIILSGTGTDGASGIRAVRAAGGTTIAQDPEDAQYDGMPRAAISTRCVDIVVPTTDMSAVLARLLGPAGAHSEGEADQSDDAVLKRLVTYVRRSTGFDFSYYKPTTVNRRLSKRMGLRHIDSLSVYEQRIRADPDEAKALVADLLISVTQFFRDPNSFKALSKHLADVLANGNNDNVFRVWIPGCATGEEAYTIAIILSEIAASIEKPLEFLIFATDLDENALSVGRAGQYEQSSVKGLSEHILSTYFDKEQQRYAIKKFVRQSVVFASQNVVDDPPFSRVNLISCRNLLIYFTGEAQKRVMETFRYALTPGGTMFLGNAESIELHKEAFEEIDRSARLYRRRNTGPAYLRRSPISKPTVARSRAIPTEAGVNPGAARTARLMQQVMNKHCPTVVVLDPDDAAVHFIGDSSPYLSIQAGQADFNLFQLANPNLRPELRALVHRSRRTGADVSVGPVDFDDSRLKISVGVLNTPDDGYRSVVFEPMTSASVPDGGDDDSSPSTKALVISELESELASTRMRLQTVVEELETSNEELQSQSEELQSANEEMQSTNEELQTSNEEMQSSNEELLTLNEELNTKSHELETTAYALTNIKQSIHFPMFVVDISLCVLQFNQAGFDLCEVGGKPTVGASLLGLKCAVDLVGVVPSIRAVIAEGHAATEVAQLESEHGRFYDVHCMPYRQGEGEVLGVLLSLVDVTERNQAQAKLRETVNALVDASERADVTLSSINEGVITTDTEEVITYANPAAVKLLNVDHKSLVGKPISDIFKIKSADGDTEHEVAPVTRALNERHAVTSPSDCYLDVGDDNKIAIECSAAPLRNHAAELIGAVLAFRDVTSNQLLTEELSYRASHDPLTGLLNRDAYEERVDRAFREMRQDGFSHVLLFLDLDQFKVVNDTAGHAAGDQLLKLVCGELRAKLRQADVLARLGGDEFGVVLRHCEHKRGLEIAESLIKTVDACRFEWAGEQFRIGVSIGLVVLDDRVSSVVEAFSAADAACYEAKEEGRGRVATADFSADKRHPRFHDMQIVNRLKTALEEDRVLLFEEFAAIATKPTQLPYRELLVRMVDPDGGIVPPAQFIPAAERYFLMGSLDRYVIKHALARLKKEASQKGAFAGVTSINISGQSIGDEKFGRFVFDAVQDSGVDASLICFEITETAAISRMVHAVRFMKRVKELGCRFALDDFGTGMSSLSYLRTLPVDYIKIDGSFVQNMQRSIVDRTMVEAICKIAKQLKLQTIAEYVQTDESRTDLAAIGVDFVQGELIGLASAPKPGVSD